MASEEEKIVIEQHITQVSGRLFLFSWKYLYMYVEIVTRDWTYQFYYMHRHFAVLSVICQTIGKYGKYPTMYCYT